MESWLYIQTVQKDRPHSFCNINNPSRLQVQWGRDIAPPLFKAKFWRYFKLGANLRTLLRYNFRYYLFTDTFLYRRQRYISITSIQKYNIYHSAWYLKYRFSRHVPFRTILKVSTPTVHTVSHDTFVSWVSTNVGRVSRGHGYTRGYFPRVWQIPPLSAKIFAHGWVL